MNQKIKISQLPAKGSNLAAADLLEIAEFTGTGYISKSITGQELIDAIPAPSVDWGDIGGTLSDQTDLNTALSGKVPTTRTLTINGTTQDLSADRTFTISTGITIGTTLITSGTVGRVLFEGTGNVVQESANLFWDNTNGRLGIGTSTPTSALTVGSAASANSVSGTTPLIAQGSANSNFNLYVKNDSTGSTASAQIVTQVGGTGGAFGIYATYPSSYNYGVYPANGSALINGGTGGLALVASNANGIIKFATGGELAAQERMRIFSTGNFAINTTTDAGFRLDVNGTARVQGNTTIVGSGPTLNINPTADTQISALYLNNTAGAIRTALYQNLSTTESRLWVGSGQFTTIWSNNSERIRIINGNVLINTTTDAGFRLDVNGTARVQGAFSALNASTQGIMLRNDYTQFPAIEWWATTYKAGITRETNNGLTTDAGGFAMHTVGAGTLIGGVNRFDLNASAQLQVQSTTKGFLKPRLTTTQKNAIASPAAGLEVYDTTLNRPCFYDGTTWITL